MSFDVVTTSLASAVASAGTITLAYPTGRSAGDYTGAHAHKMYAMGANFAAPNDFTVAFGATIVVTYNGSTTIPAGTTVRFQFDQLGSDDVQEVILPNNLVPARMHLIDLGAPITLDADGLIKAATSTELPDTETVTYTIATAGTSPLDGASQTWVLDAPRNITATVTHDSSVVAMTIKVTGKDVFDVEMYEEMSIAATGTSQTAAGLKAFKEVTSVAITAAADAEANTLNLGWGDVLGLPVYVPDASYVAAEMEDGVCLPRKPGYVYIPFHYGATQINAGTGWFINSPVAGRIIELRTAVEIAFTTGGAVTVNVGATPVDGLSVTIGTEAADELDSDTATAGHASAVVAKGDLITILGASGFDSAGAINGVLVIAVDPDDQMDGTFVAGVTSKATATTGDVRGTYDATTACDGSTSFALLAMLADPGNRGVPQYAA